MIRFGDYIINVKKPKNEWYNDSYINRIITRISGVKPIFYDNIKVNVQQGYEEKFYDAVKRFAPDYEVKSDYNWGLHSTANAILGGTIGSELATLAIKVGPAFSDMSHNSRILAAVLMGIPLGVSCMITGRIALAKIREDIDFKNTAYKFTTDSG